MAPHSKHALLADCAVGLAVFAVVAVAITADVGGQRGPDAIAYLFAACLGALMLVRRTFPVLALVATGAGLLAYHAAGYPPIGLAIPVTAALYSAAEAGRLRAAMLTAVTLLAISTAFRATHGESLAYLFGFEMASTVGLLVAAIALGDTVRGRRLLEAEQQDRLRRAAVEREREADRRVEEERLRIARDLHDVLAHTVAIVSVQAAVASESINDDPAAATSALAAIRTATDEAFGELRSTLDVLRPSTEDRSRAPADSIRHLDVLVAATARSGLPVDVRVEGQPRPLPMIVDSTAYRIVREALTNSLRHAGATRAELLLRYEPGRLTIRLGDDGRGGAAPPGRGITGMRERATLAGGEVTAGPGAEGGFVVEAVLPWENRP